MTDAARTTNFLHDWRSGRRGLRLADLERADPYVRQALEDNKRQGLLLAVRARWISLAIIAVLLFVLNPRFEMLYYELCLAVFALIGWAQLKAGRSVAQSRAELALMFADIALMVAILTGPNPLSDNRFPTAFVYQLGDFSYLFIFLAGATLAYSWRTVVAYATWTSLLVLVALGLVLVFGRDIPELTGRLSDALGDYPEILREIDPNNPHVDRRIQELVIFVIVAGFLAVNSRRSTRLILEQARMARERANLARHFAPNLVDQMAEQNEPLGAVRSQNVAVLFVDIVGFTSLAERMSPEETVSFLRDFHARMEATVFEHDGTLDKYLGDGLMATFGTPQTGPRDAENALKCGLAMLAAVKAWNRERAGSGAAPVRIGVGIHYGPVVLGDIGSARRLEYAVLGDTVNVASRLEGLTRQLDADLVASEALIRAVGADKAAALGVADVAQPRQLRGRHGEIGIWSA